MLVLIVHCCIGNKRLMSYVLIEVILCTGFNNREEILVKQCR